MKRSTELRPQTGKRLYIRAYIKAPNPNSHQVTFTEDSIGYRPNPTSATRLPKALSSHLTRTLRPHPNVPVTPDSILIASSPTALGHMLGFSLAEPGDGILVSRPVYGRFELDYGVEAGVEMVYADTDAEEAFLPAVVEKYEMALREAGERGVRIRGVVLVNPHNPVGMSLLLLTSSHCQSANNP